MCCILYYYGQCNPIIFCKIQYLCCYKKKVHGNGWHNKKHFKQQRYKSVLLDNCNFTLKGLNITMQNLVHSLGLLHAITKQYDISYLIRIVPRKITIYMKPYLLKNINFEIVQKYLNLQWMKLIHGIFSSIDGMVSCQSYCVVLWGCNSSVHSDHTRLFLNKCYYFTIDQVSIRRN